MLVLALAACGGDDGDLPDGRVASVDAPDAIVDAPTSDADTRLACLGDPAPGLSGAVTITGRVFDIVDYQATQLAGAVVELRRRADDTILDGALSGDDGEFTLAGAAPLDAYIVVTAAGRLPSYAYVESDAMWTGGDALVFVASAGELTRWYIDAGTIYVAGARTVLAVMRDCDFEPASGATLAVTPAQPVIYYDETAMRWDPALTSASNGFALLANAPASVDVAPQLDAAFPVETIAPRADAVTLAVVTPYD